MTWPYIIMWIKWVEEGDHIRVSLPWLIIMNKLSRQTLYTSPWSHDFSALLFPFSHVLFFSIMPSLGQERVSYPSPISSWPLLCISPGTWVQELFFLLFPRQRSFNSTLLPEGVDFSPGSWGWEGFPPFLRSRYCLQYHLHISRGPFPEPQVLEGLLPLPHWLKNLFYMRPGSKDVSGNLQCSLSELITIGTLVLLRGSLYCLQPCAQS